MLATAVAAHTDAPGWDTPGLGEARAQMIALFTERFGYTLVDTLGMNPTSTQLLRELRAFCKSPERRADDLIVLYYTGHGERLDATGEHVLITADTDPTDIEGAIATAYLARQMLLGTEVRRLLVLLDTCYSGQGGADFAGAALTSCTRHWGEEPGNGVVVVSSTQPMQWARAGMFPRLFTDAVDSLAVAGYSPPTLPLDTVITTISITDDRAEGQTIEATLARVNGAIPPFLPNPRHDPKLNQVDLAVQLDAQRAEHERRREVEFRDRLLLRAMGSTDGRSWWFSGRHTALTEITAWLRDPDRDRPLLAVTAGPGSGKTAVLGIIATLAHPEYRRAVPTETLALPTEAIPAVGVLDAVIYAQNLTLDQVRDGIAAAAHLSAATVGELLDRLTGRARVFTVLIDGLDEATDPEQLISSLLRPLLEHANGRIRLLVGTRPYLLDRLGTDRDHEIDLDALKYADRDALATYAARALLGTDPNGIYRKRSSGVLRAVALAVAEQAHPSFLVARIVAATLAADATVPDPTDPQWRAGLPRLPGEAMRHDLDSRLGEDAQRARDLLRPLAFAQGQGLPWEDLWAAIASALSGVDYTDHDLMWLRRTAGSYVVEAVENDRSAYRLYHQALAEHLTEDLDPHHVHTIFTQTLWRHALTTGDPDTDWSRAHPYTLTHLATHATHAGLVDDLVTDIDYLVHAQPAPLLDALHTVTTTTGLLTRSIYRCSADHHRYLRPIRRRQLLAIDAARFDATDQQHQLNRGLNWHVLWATGNQTHHAHLTTLTGHTSQVSAVACTEIDGRPVAVTASDDNSVRVWDLSTGQQRAHLTGHTSQVSAVACTEIDGRPVAVTASDDNSVRVWDLSTGQQRAHLTGHTSLVSAVACTEIDGRPVAVTGSNDKSVRVWDLSTGQQRAHLTGHTGTVYAVACTEIDGRPVAVTGSNDKSVRVWDLSTGQQRAHLTGHTEWVLAVACTEIDGRPVAVTASIDSPVRVWDLSTGQQIAHLTGHTSLVLAVACTEIDGRPVAVTGSGDQSVRIWEIDPAGLGTLLNHLRRRQAGSTSPIRTPDQTIATREDGGKKRSTATPRHVQTHLTGHIGAVFTLACTEIDGRPVAVTGSGDQSVRVWDLWTGQQLTHLTGHTGWVDAVACTEIDGRPVAVTGSNDHTVRVWDLSTGQQLTHLTGHTDTVYAVACTEIDGRPVAVTGSYDDSVRVWDLSTGQQRAHLTGHTDTVYAVACTEIDGRPVAVTASDDNSVRVWDLSTGQQRAHLTGHTDTVYAVACTEIDGRPVAVTASYDQSVRVWDLSAATERARSSRFRWFRRARVFGASTVLAGHTGRVSAVASLTVDGRSAVATVSEDRTVRVWDPGSQTVLAVIDCPSPPRAVGCWDGGIVVGFGSDVAVLARPRPESDTRAVRR
ncbi:caspase family protein [Nocardia sp. NBC_01377]|uniref:caspase family protein n=1 Tax=Nocardia sp. NBC_01377 TaxID=2903595 RepID=UPI003247A15F